MINNMEFAQKRQPVYFYLTNSIPILRGVIYELCRYNGNAQIIGCRVNQCKGAGTFPNRMDNQVFKKQAAVYDFPGTAVLFPQEKRLTGKLLQGGKRFLCKWIVFTADNT